MRKFFIVIPLVLFLLIGVLYIRTHVIDHAERTFEFYKEKQEGAIGYMKWLEERRTDPATEKINMTQFVNARKIALLHQLSGKREAQLNWTELGPTNWGGRTRAFLIDRNNRNILYAGSVSGGLWKSENAGMNWSKIDAFDGNLNIASICQSINGEIYIGTGEGMYDNYGEATGGLPGNGIYKSKDGCKTFFHLDSTLVVPPTNSETWCHVNRLVAHPFKENTIFASTEKGIRKSIDGGETWFVPNGATLMSPSSDIDIAFDSSVIVASIGGKYFRSLEGHDFEDMSGKNGFPFGSSGRLEFAVSPTNSNYIYASTTKGNGKLRGIYQSKDKGESWKAIALGGNNIFYPFSYAKYNHGQGGYDHTIMVSSKNPDKIFLGGIRLYNWSSTAGWNKIASTSESNIGSYVHADMHWIEEDPIDHDIIYFVNDGGIFKSFDGGVSFAPLTHGYATMQMYGVAVSDSGDVLGGMQDNGTHYIDYRQKTNTSSVDPLGGDGGYTDISWVNNNVFFASYQYPSTRRSSNKGEEFFKFWDENISPGRDSDGELENPDGSFVTPFILWEGIGESVFDTIIEALLHSNPQSNVAEVIYDTIVESIANPSRFFIGLTNNVWMTREALDFNVVPEWYRIGSISGDCESIAISDDGDVLWVGTGIYASNGKLYRFRGIRNAKLGYHHKAQILDSLSDNDTIFYVNSKFIPDSAKIEATEIISPLGNKAWGRVVTGLSVDPNDPSHVVMVMGNYDGSLDYVYESTNALDSMPEFQSIQGTGLISAPIYSVVIDEDSSKKIFLGTEYGVYMTNNGNGNDSLTQWQYVGPEKVAVFAMKQVDLSDNLPTIEGTSLFIGTHGRGMWSHNFDPCRDRGFCYTGIAEGFQQRTKSINIFPNPATDLVHINVITLKLAAFGFSVYDLSGKLVYHQDEMKTVKGNNKFNINVKDWPSGVYLINSYLDIGKYCDKLIVL